MEFLRSLNRQTLTRIGIVVVVIGAGTFAVSRARNNSGTKTETPPPSDPGFVDDSLSKSEDLPSNKLTSAYPHIATVVSAEDPLRLNRECGKVQGDLLTPTNQVVTVIVESLGKGPVAIYQSGKNVGNYNPQTQVIPANLLGLSPEDLIACLEE